MTSSPLQGALPSDRLVAEWWLKSSRVQTVLGGATSHFETLVRVSVPADIYLWKSASAPREKARLIQEQNRLQLQDAFAKGMSILGYERDSAGNGSFLLGAWDESLMY